MANIAETLGRLTTEELDGLRGLGPQGHLTKPLVEALDRAAGGAGAGRGYYVPTGSVSETGGPVQGFDEGLGQMALRAKAPQSVEFFRG